MKTMNELKAHIDEREFKGFIQFPEDVFGKEDLFVAYADGNGMTGFGINDGDTLFFSREREPKSGDVVMAKADGQVFIRQILVNDKHGTFILHANGTEKREDVETAEPGIFGVLVYILKKVWAM